MPYEKLTTMTTFPGLAQERHNIPTEMAMYMAMTEGMFLGFDSRETPGLSGEQMGCKPWHCMGLDMNWTPPLAGYKR